MRLHTPSYFTGSELGDIQRWRFGSVNHQDLLQRVPLACREKHVPIAGQQVCTLLWVIETDADCEWCLRWDCVNGFTGEVDIPTLPSIYRTELTLEELPKHNQNIDFASKLENGYAS